jgi:hypothetical protein
VNREPEVGIGACRDEDLRIAVGALALGALDPEEAREVRQHLAECPECQAEYTSFAGVKRVMDIGLVGAPMPEVVPAQRSRRRSPFRAPAASGFGMPLRRRILVGTAGFAAAFALVVGGFWFGHDHRPGSGGPPATALPAVTQSGVTAQISYQDHSWGTSLSAKMSGTPNGLDCKLFVVAKNQAAIQLSNWRSVAGKVIDVPAATSLTPGQIDHFEVKVDGYGAYDIMVPMTS